MGVLYEDYRHDFVTYHFRKSPKVISFISKFLPLPLIGFSSTQYSFSRSVFSFDWYLPRYHAIFSFIPQMVKTSTPIVRLIL